MAELIGFVGPYAGMLAALGAMTVGVMEAWKKLFATLARFNRRAVGRWLADGSAGQGWTPVQALATLRSVPYSAPSPGASYKPERAYAQLLHLTTGLPMGDGQGFTTGPAPLARNVSLALFELEIAKMCSQIQEAADAALNNPTRYPDWYRFLTRGCAPSDLVEWEAVLAGGADKEARERGAAAYARIRLLARRQLDGFQTVTAFRWREWNQLWAWFVGGALMAVALLLQGYTNWLTVGLSSLAGGLLAPVAKDLVDALAKAKREL